MAACNLVARAGAIVVAALTARSESSKVRRRWVPPLAAGLFAVEAAWVARRFTRQHSSHDETAAMLDVGTSVFALVAERLAHGHRQRPGGPRFGIDYAAGSLTFASGETADPWRLAASALMVGATYTSAVEGSATARINDLAIITSGVALQPLLTQYRHYADDVDIARAGAIRQAEKLAIERERLRQRRILHDSALQILEAVSGGWQIDDDLLLARIDYEIERLDQMSRSTSVEHAPRLSDRLAHLSADLRLEGFTVHLDASEFEGQTFVGLSLDALHDALQEALVNVRKHSGATHVTIVASRTNDWVEVSVADDGAGFDTANAAQGFGITQSICGRLLDVGGSASIESEPGHGTHVTLRVPQ